MGVSENATARGLISGALTGVLEISMNYPFKYIKTQLQLERKLGKEKLYSGIFDCAKRTVLDHGFLGLYRGLNPLLYAPKSALRFGVFELMKEHMVDEKGQLRGHDRFLCGLVAGAVEAAVVNTPLETVETKLINDQRSGGSKYRGFFHGMREIIKEEGVKGVYRGLYPSVLKQASNQGIRFFVVETLKDQYQGGDSSVPIPKLVIGLFGAAAGFFSVMGNNPMDVVKTRMQGLDAARYRNFFDCFVQIWRHEGFFSFYRGAGLRLSRVIMEVSAQFVIYQYFQDAFQAFSRAKEK